MNKFHVGQKIRIKKFLKDEYPSWWTPQMRDGAGQTYTIKEISSKKILLYKLYDFSAWGWKESDFEEIEYLDNNLFEI